MGRGYRRDIPDGWLDYEPIKNVMEDIKIVPFKVPLPVLKFNNDFLKRHKWTPADVMQRVPNLGLVIDLTFKFPCYYEPVQFLENGIDYIKIGCLGHVIPPKEIFLKFCDTIDTFVQEHPDLVIGIHCTHGINRTGYMICRYMVVRRGYTAKDALQTFADKRGYAIERENYIEDIYRPA